MSGYENYSVSNLLVMAGLIVGMLVVFVCYMQYERRKQRKRLMARIRSEWGQELQREYDAAEYDAISHYYLNRETDAFQVDDITWNDLDLDRVFRMLNHTRSFLGESYLYYQLRTPELHPEKLAGFERLVSYFQEHTKEREEIEFFFAKIGKTGRQSIFDYIYNLASVHAGSNLVHFSMCAFLAASVGMLFVVPQAGVLLVLAASGLSMATYEHYKRPIAPYVTSCAALERLLSQAENMLKLDSPLIQERKERLKKLIRVFQRLRRNMTFLLLGDQVGGGIEQLLISYINNLLHIDLILFPTVVKDISAHMREFEELTEELGKLESAIAVASFRELYPNHTLPELRKEGALSFRADGLYHPLISDPVANSIDTEQSVLLTGANASGKSSFLKTVALAAILAQTIHTVPAKRYEARYFRVYSSMALRDDLAAEESYYMVEIRSLKRILDRMDGGEPILCLVDEVLRGTNTIERVAASSQILKRIARANLLCFAATHDLELTYLLEGIYRNCHFEEEVTEEEIRFDYLLKEGRATTRNAIRLLALMGFEKEIIDSAQKLAEELAESNASQQSLRMR